jgi:hypothetical protein
MSLGRGYFPIAPGASEAGGWALGGGGVTPVLTQMVIGVPGGWLLWGLSPMTVPFAVVELNSLTCTW